MPEEPERELLQRFVHGDRDAFEVLFRQFEGDVYRWILRIVRERAAAEDTLIEAFWRSYRSRARFDPSRSFGAWMRRIATHAALDQLKTMRGRMAQLPASATDRPTREVEERDWVIPDAIARAFRALPPKLQVVAVLALVEGRPHEEIADALDVPIGTVKSRLFRATRLLRTALSRMGVHA